MGGKALSMDHSRVLAQYRDGMSPMRIAEAENVSESAVRELLDRLGELGSRKSRVIYSNPKRAARAFLGYRRNKETK